MEIKYRSEGLGKELESDSKLRKKHGKRRAELIEQRLFEFRAAQCLQDLRNLPGPRLHQHTRQRGQAKAVFSVDLDHPYRLLFEAAHEPEPTYPAGGVDWSQVTAILIRGIKDTHHG